MFVTEIMVLYSMMIFPELSQVDDGAAGTELLCRREEEILLLTAAAGKDSGGELLLTGTLLCAGASTLVEGSDKGCKA